MGPRVSRMGQKNKFTAKRSGHTAMKDSAKLRSVAAVAGRKNNGAASVRSEVGGLGAAARIVACARAQIVAIFALFFTRCPQVGHPDDMITPKFRFKTAATSRLGDRPTMQGVKRVVEDCKGRCERVFSVPENQMLLCVLLVLLLKLSGISEAMVDYFGAEQPAVGETADL